MKWRLTLALPGLGGEDRAPALTRRVSAEAPATIPLVAPVGDQVPFGAYRTYVNVTGPSSSDAVRIEFKVVRPPLTARELWNRALTVALAAVLLAYLLSFWMGERLGMSRMTRAWLASAAVHVIALWILQLTLFNPVNARVERRIPLRMVQIAGLPGFLSPQMEGGFEDIRALAHPVLRHRVLTNFHAEASGVSSTTIIRQRLDQASGERRGNRRGPDEP